MIDPEAARRAAHDILSGPDYSQPAKGIVERVVDWVFARLGDVVGTLTGGGAGTLIGWLVVIGIVSAAGWLLARALRVTPTGRRPGAEGLRYGTESPRDAGVWLEEAARLAAAGDHHGALRCRHQALLARLITGGVVDDSPGRTAAEYRAVIEAQVPSEATTLDRLTRQFEDAWYGGDPVDGADYVAFADACGQVEAAALDRSRVSAPVGAS